MSKRMEKIYQYIVNKINTFSHIKKTTVVTTSEVAGELKIQRSNASKDLNQLVRDGRLIKLKGRPVEYTLVQEKIDELSEKYVPSYKEERQPREKRKPQRVSTFVPVKDIFSNIIGINGSMKNAGEQAKAAILYPPKGLNCLITGPTGSGKTYFAHAMFQFAKANQVIGKEKELIVFNCADYANNPELLMSHLFGYAKGAFTGADKEKLGVIDQADGSMLFLDEIHRLPPEGQEMIFYFMDYGSYSRLGETGKNHYAEVRIVGATTEDSNSALLDTFMRRIPINIQLPSFEKRPAVEKLDLVKVMVSHEASRIQRTVSLTEDVVKALIGSVSFGNIGQLKSNVQLVCARGFLNHVHQRQIDITLEDVPEGIRSGLIMLANKRETLMELSQNLESKMVIQPNEDILNIQSDSYELPYNLYDIIGDKAALLKADGVDQEAINNFISTDINVHLKSFYKDHGFSFHADNKLSEFVDQKVIELTNRIHAIVCSRLDYDFQQNFVYAMSLHISSFLKKIQLGEKRHTNDNIREMVADYPEEFKVAQEIRQFIGEWFNVTIPESEEYYLAVLLVSLRNSSTEGKIGVVVAAHGNSTATSMVDVVKQLLGVEQVVAVDMPLDMSTKIALEKMKQAVLSVHDGSGVLLLVDMGSLVTFNVEIQRETGVFVRTIDMVTTSVVLEAVRKASVLGMNLEDLYESLKNFRGYSDFEDIMTNFVESHLPRAILAICASGEGAAKQIKEMICAVLDKKRINDIEVVTLSAVDLQNTLPEVQKRYQVIASTGVVDPQLAVPFISLENFVTKDIDELIEHLLIGNGILNEGTTTLDYKETKQVCMDFLEKNFTFLNPKKMIDPLWQFTEDIMNTWRVSKEEEGFRINFLLHAAGMLERVLLHQPLTGAEEEERALQDDEHYDKLHVHVLSLGRILNLTIPLMEEFYLLALIKRQLEK
ncbi:sigma 54-interacting transcriptional regulator [Clostridium sp. D2Q-14]|uniref:sigma-54-dependent transcriptional regulator n=1 Tax=Anaeromonas gelatinilytica TaxID=2683194 RepID=UPI00193B24F4|nr:sigma-54-dependent transcriptional regulator [Anaeromonas gelatinilytica]MBS4534488.1 sigma 54-interacting transcriptional regulator [Anaeromonas gelatinilytica]